MSTTFGALKTRVALVLQDPANQTFATGLVEELIFAALVEVGMIAPEQFTEDLTPVANQLSYAVRSADFSGEAQPEIDIARVEVWDASQSPEAFILQVPEAGTEFSTGDSGWSMWGGTLTLPTLVVRSIAGYEADYVYRVWGYSPYVQPSADADVLSISKEVEQAVLAYTRVEALEQLNASRDLFTQWQTRSGNTDISPAGLMNQLNIARDGWRRKARSLARLRAQV